MVNLTVQVGLFDVRSIHYIKSCDVSYTSDLAYWIPLVTALDTVLQDIAKSLESLRHDVDLFVVSERMYYPSRPIGKENTVISDSIMSPVGTETSTIRELVLTTYCNWQISERGASISDQETLEQAPSNSDDKRALSYALDNIGFVDVNSHCERFTT